MLKADEIGKTINIEPKIIVEEFEVQYRLKLYDFLSSFIYFVLALTMAVALVVFFIYINSQIQSKAVNSLIVGSFNLGVFIIGLFSAVLAAKIAGILLDKFFADSLILLSSLYLVIDLNHRDDLSNRLLKEVFWTNTFTQTKYPAVITDLYQYQP